MIEYNEEECGWDDVLEVVDQVDIKKIPHFKKIIDGYDGCLGGKNTNSLESVRGEFSHKDIAIRVNPEIALEINGIKHIVKLFLRKDELDPGAAKIYLGLMECALRERCGDSYVFAIMDVRRSKLYKYKIDSSKYTPYLRAEMDFISSAIGEDGRD